MTTIWIILDVLLKTWTLLLTFALGLKLAQKRAVFTYKGTCSVLQLNVSIRLEMPLEPRSSGLERAEAVMKRIITIARKMVPSKRTGRG